MQTNVISSSPSNGQLSQIIAQNEIHLWLASLELSKAYLHYLWGLLSIDERQRADRFRFERDRLHFIASRGTLRCILSEYTDLPSEGLRFRYGASGKPALTEDCNPGDLRFNLSHSHELALYALVLHHEIGVDIEHTRLVRDVETLARRFFSRQEYETLRSLPEQQKLGAFYNCWIRKEAYIKACGDGLSQPLDRFEVSLAPDKPAQLLSIDDNQAEASRWYLHGFEPAPGYIAALAVEGGYIHPRLSTGVWLSRAD
jgi:4'-phosphopantetheinyl transferase